ncbi:transcriptional regulator [Croceibacterium mercuriale]|uniref:Transcriptional regulator n=1 Tax=Croceibacterium mercuriale TaxID=1572751 RepID=A0A0B2C393_9SPHN|nr:cupin-like domain-containing protein [Croceibacterium mercuriale]KHL26712.1 transcriptional regulator [Croceibacterium mercuriale]
MTDPAALRDPDAFRTSVMARYEPVVLRGAARHWPLVSCGDVSLAAEQIMAFDSGRETDLFVGKPEIGGSYRHADERLRAFNFTHRTLPFREALQQILETAGQPDHDTMYMGSLTSETYLPGVERLTPVAFVPSAVRPRFWIGHVSSVPCHYDTMDNLACVVAGRRRFTLYPPDAIGDLYVGPIDRTMAGQPISLAASGSSPDARYPRFERARGRALVAELEPGDAIYLPKLWWHQVEATSDINMLVNFWWDGFAAGPDKPYTTMLLAMIAIAERPAAERAAWRAWFDHYVFRPDGHPLQFLDAEVHGVLGPLRAGNYGRIRAMVLRLLRGE